MERPGAAVLGCLMTKGGREGAGSGERKPSVSMERGDRFKGARATVGDSEPGERGERDTNSIKI